MIRKKIDFMDNPMRVSAAGKTGKNYSELSLTFNGPDISSPDIAWKVGDSVRASFSLSENIKIIGGASENLSGGYTVKLSGRGVDLYREIPHISAVEIEIPEQTEEDDPSDFDSGPSQP